MDMRCREQPEKWDDSGRDTKGCSSERHIYFWNLIKKLIHSSGNFYKSGSGEQPFVKRKWNRASLTVEASLALPVFLIAVLVLLKIVDRYRLHGMLTVSLQESARYLPSVPTRWMRREKKRMKYQKRPRALLMQKQRFQKKSAKMEW